MNDQKKDRLKYLLSMKHSIYDKLSQHKGELDQIKKAKAIDINDLLQFSRNITLTSRAPNGWQPGFPLYNSHPPAPQPEEMRAGVLAAYTEKYKKLYRISEKFLCSEGADRTDKTIVDEEAILKQYQLWKPLVARLNSYTTNSIIGAKRSREDSDEDVPVRKKMLTEENDFSSPEGKEQINEKTESKEDEDSDFDL